MRLGNVFPSVVVGAVALVWLPGVVWAASVPVTGTAKVLNTANSYLDFTNYNSNVTINDATGNWSGYAFMEDVGWVAFGSADNALGPVNVNLTSGAVTGKAKILNTGNSYLDFTNYNSNVTANVTTGAMTGDVFSEDMGWLDFADAGVTASATLDTVAPVAFSLIDPGNLSYTTNQRPGFKWRTSSDATSGLAKYTLEIENGYDKDNNLQKIVVPDIPPSRTSDYETSRYYIKYEGFSDGDATNNYITVWTKSSSDWSSDQNDGWLREGKRPWKVIATDNVGNQKAETRTVFVDRTSPRVEVTQINSSSYADYLVTPDTTPAVFGKLIDPLAGDSQASDSQKVNDNKVASSPKSLEIRLEKRNYAGLYDLHSVVTQQLTHDYWTSDGKQIADNSLQTSDKYSSFSFTPAQALAYGAYRVTITGRDEVDQASSALVFRLTIGSYQTLFTPDEIEQIEQTVEKEVESTRPDLSDQEKTDLKEELIQQALEEAVKPEEPAGPSLITQVVQFISQTAVNSYWGVVGGAKRIVAMIGNGVSTLASAVGSGFSSAGEQLAKVLPGVANWTQDRSSQLAGWRQARLAWLAGVWAGSPAQELADDTRLWLAMTGEIFLDRESTYISNVSVAEVGVDFAVITWETNHHTANNKVNFGTDLSYGRDAVEPERSRFHQVRLEGLEQSQRYVFEVMSEGKNYTYDSHHQFVTLPEQGSWEEVKGIMSTSGPITSGQNWLIWLLALAVDALAFYVLSRSLRDRMVPSL